MKKLFAYTATMVLLSAASAAQLPCGAIPGVEVSVDPPVAGLGEEVKVTLTNNSGQLIQLSSSCTYQSVHPFACGGLAVFSPFCLTVITPIPPGSSHTTSWFQNDDNGNQVPPGQYAFEVRYFDGSFATFNCCPTVQVCSSPPTAAAEVVRLGSPPNPPAFLPGVSGGPVIGTTWDPVVDHTTFQPTAVLDFVGISGVFSNVPSVVGTILCGTSPPIVATSPAGAPFAIAVPADCSAIGAALCAQGGSIDAIGAIALANGLDITIGTF